MRVLKNGFILCWYVNVVSHVRFLIINLISVLLVLLVIVE